MSDIEIARAASKKPIQEIAAKIGISNEHILPYGHDKAKVSEAFIKSLSNEKDGHLILVTAINPTPAGEGKTTTTVGLGDGLNAIGKKAAVCIREASLGPCFGMKGGAAGGGYAQYASCPEEQAIPTPEGISLTNSASLPEVFATCWLNLFHEANMQENDIVLLHAGASGIGTAAIQLCNLFNCKSFVTASTHEKISYCIKLGAENGSLRSNKPFDDVKNWAPDGVDIILDPVGGSYFQDNLNVLSIEGRLLLIGLMGGTKSEINLGQVLMKRQKIIGSTIRARSSIVKGKVMNDLLEKVWPHFKSKKIKPIIYKTMSIENANQAHEIMEKDENIGKLVLEIN